MAPDGRFLARSASDSLTMRQPHNNALVILDMQTRTSHTYHLTAGFITLGKHGEINPEWSPDGTSVALIVQRANEPTTLDGKELFIGADLIHPIWSPDSRYIIAQQSNSPYEFCIIEVGISQPERLPFPPGGISIISWQNIQP